MIRLLTVGTLAGVLCLTIACTHTQSATGTASAAGSNDGKTCRRVTDTGSAVPHRECHTPEQWAAIDRENQANTDNRVRSR